MNSKELILEMVINEYNDVKKVDKEFRYCRLQMLTYYFNQSNIGFCKECKFFTDIDTNRCSSPRGEALS